MNIENEIRPRIYNYYGDIRTMYFLQKRITQNDSETIRNLCTSGRFHVDSKSVNFGTTLLHYAVRYKKHDIITLLLDILNASTDIQDNLGQTAFYHACERGFMYIVKIFTTHRVNISTFLNKPDSRGMTPLLVAYQNNHNPVCKWLISKGADYNHVSSNGFHIESEHLENRFITQVNMMRYLRTPYSDTNRRVRRRIGFTPISTSSVDNTPSSPPRLVVRGISIFSTPVTIQEENEKEVPTFLANEYIDMMIELKKTCQICFEPYQKDKVVIMKKCGHSACSTCFSKIDKCHMCRISF